jgi:hypothetical protein
MVAAPALLSFIGTAIFTSFPNPLGRMGTRPNSRLPELVCNCRKASQESRMLSSRLDPREDKDRSHKYG